MSLAIPPPWATDFIVDQSVPPEEPLPDPHAAMASADTATMASAARRRVALIDYLPLSRRPSSKRPEHIPSGGVSARPKSGIRAHRTGTVGRLGESVGGPPGI